MAPAWLSNTDLTLTPLLCSPHKVLIFRYIIPFVPRLTPEYFLIWYGEILSLPLPPLHLYYANNFAIPTLPKITGTIDDTFVQGGVEAHHAFAS